MTKQEYTHWAEKMLELNPKWNSIFIGSDGLIMWCEGVVFFRDGYWVIGSATNGDLYEVNIDFDWKDSLVVRDKDKENIKWISEKIRESVISSDFGRTAPIYFTCDKIAKEILEFLREK